MSTETGDEYRDVVFADRLTTREREIVTLMLTGLNNREIGERLHLAYETVKWYSKRIYNKLEVRNRVQLIAKIKGIENRAALTVERGWDHGFSNQINTPFVGREKALETLHQWLRTDRLLLIVGPGGMGKTRLAVEIAQQLEASDARQVIFVSLQSTKTRDRLILALADRFQININGVDSPLSQLVDNLPQEPTLLILDNFEAVTDGDAILPVLLERRHSLQILVTSRHLLQNRLTKVFYLDGFRIDQENHTQSDGHLFFERIASLIRPDFSLSTHFDTISEIVQLLGGSPLALELAAGWVNTFSCTQILAELHKGIDLLESNSSDLDPRHRSMEMVCQQSWERLPETARLPFLRLALFEGSFDFAAAQTVAGLTIRQTRQLVDHSMLRFNGIDRYQIHPVLRRFGQKLVAERSVDRQEILHAHANYYLDQLARIEPMMRSTQLPEAIDAIERNLDNFIQAWEFGVQDNLNDLLVNASVPLARFFEISDRSKFGALLFRPAVDKLPAGSSGRAVARLYMGWHEIWLGNTEAGEAAMFNAIERLDALELQLNHPFVIAQLSFNESYRPEISDALLLRYKNGIAQYLSQHNEWGSGWVEYGLGNLYRARGDLEHSVNSLRSSYRRFKEIGDMYGLMWAADALSTTYLRQGALEKARKMAEQLYLSSDRLAYTTGLVISTEKFGLIELARGRDHEAYKHFCQMLRFAARNKNATNIVPALLNLGTILAGWDKHRALAVSIFTLVKADHSSRQGWFSHRIDECERWLEQLRGEMPVDQYVEAQRSVSGIDRMGFVDGLLAGNEFPLELLSPDI